MNIASAYKSGYEHGYAKANTELREAKEAYEQLRKQVDYWSYCTRYGMYELCPEEWEKLKKFNSSLGISPA
jgi:hypothetical protein